MPHLIKEILINALPEIIWTSMVQHLKYPEKEAEHGPEWNKLVIKDIKGKSLSPNRTGIGVKTRWYYKFHFLSFNWDDEVVEWEELRKIKWKSISTWEMVDSFTIKLESNGSRLIYEMDYTPPYGILGQLWYRLLVNKNLEKHLEYTILLMKRSAEAIQKFKESKMNGT